MSNMSNGWAPRQISSGARRFYRSEHRSQTAKGRSNTPTSWICHPRGSSTRCDNHYFPYNLEVTHHDPAMTEGAKVFAADSPETQIGVITSGIPSPTLGTNIAMGYVKSGHHKKGTKVLVEVRKKLREAEVRGMPFVPTKYWKGVTPA